LAEALPAGSVVFGLPGVLSVTDELPARRSLSLFFGADWLFLWLFLLKE
jgi:hypothetical protein